MIESLLILFHKVMFGCETQRPFKKNKTVRFCSLSWTGFDYSPPLTKEMPVLLSCHILISVLLFRFLFLINVLYGGLFLNSLLVCLTTFGDPVFFTVMKIFSHYFHIFFSSHLKLGKVRADRK